MKLTKKYPMVLDYDSDRPEEDWHITITISKQPNWYDTQALGREVIRSYKIQEEKAEKYVNLIESFTFDFNPIDNIEEVARQFIDNEVRTTHKLYEENKQLKEELEQYKIHDVWICDPHFLEQCEAQDGESK